MTANLWKVSLTCLPTMAEAVGEALEDLALSVAVFAPPRQKTAQIELICDGEPSSAELNARLCVLAALHKTRTPSVVCEPVGNLNWLKKVAADFPPIKLGRWIVYGAAHRDKITNTHLALQIDATSAFGTGEHPTTRGCLLMLDKVLKKHSLRNALDMGCGSGILAMAFAKACHGNALAVDLDPHAVDIAKGNLDVNGLRDFVRVGVSHGYRNPVVQRHAPYDLIMANIFARPLCLMAKDLKRHLRPDGIAILSGLLNTQANAVIAAHRMQGLTLERRMVLGEWSVLMMKRSFVKQAAPPRVRPRVP